jgi:hypothetical protein
MRAPAIGGAIAKADWEDADSTALNRPLGGAEIDLLH